MPTMESVGFTPLDEKKTLQTYAIASPPPNASDCASMVVGGWAKRAFDILVAFFVLLCLAPLFLMVAVAVKLASPGPVLYGHERIGHGGRPFRCWKFRSMVTNGDEILAKYFKDHPEEHDEWIKNRKLRNDPRVTRIGAVLRAYSVDELPQIVNVLRGDMSLVGPRPVVKDELEMYGTAASHYLQGRPGITGLWQVSGRSDTSYDQRILFDTSYVLNWSLAGDLVIIARTIPTVLSSKGSY